MSAVHFHCPTCQTPLRLENRALFLGRTFSCPDCSAILLIEPRGHDGVSARIIAPAATETGPLRNPPASARSKRPTATLQPDAQPNFSAALQPHNTVVDRLSRRPALIGWSVAVLFAVILFAVIQSSDDATAPNVPHKESSNEVVANKSTDGSESVSLTAMPPPVSPDRLSDHAEVAAPVPNDNPMPSGIKPAEVKLDEAKVADDKADKAKTEEPMPKANNAANEPPVEPTPKPPPIISDETINARLNQKVASFDQSKPIPFIKLLDLLEDLAGVPIVWDLETVDDKQLQKSVSLKLQQTTVGAILDAVLKQVGLSRRVGNGQIELVPTEVVTSPKPE